MEINHPKLALWIDNQDESQITRYSKQRFAWNLDDEFEMDKSSKSGGDHVLFFLFMYLLAIFVVFVFLKCNIASARLEPRKASEECSICLEESAELSTAYHFLCDHKGFHEGCMSNYKRTSGSSFRCPLCRSPPRFRPLSSALSLQRPSRREHEQYQRSIQDESTRSDVYAAINYDESRSTASLLRTINFQTSELNSILLYAYNQRKWNSFDAIIRTRASPQYNPLNATTVSNFGKILAYLLEYRISSLHGFIRINGIPEPAVYRALSAALNSEDYTLARTLESYYIRTTSTDIIERHLGSLLQKAYFDEVALGDFLRILGIPSDAIIEKWSSSIKNSEFRQTRFLQLYIEKHYIHISDMKLIDQSFSFILQHSDLEDLSNLLDFPYYSLGLFYKHMIATKLSFDRLSITLQVVATRFGGTIQERRQELDRISRKKHNFLRRISSKDLLSLINS